MEVVHKSDLFYIYQVSLRIKVTTVPGLQDAHDNYDKKQQGSGCSCNVRELNGEIQ
jgi:hypothetical protein